MLATVTAGAVLGIDAYLVTIEADVSSGLPAFFLVGLPQGAVKEARERIIAAMGNSGYYVPPRRITLNLAPAEWTKERWVHPMASRPFSTEAGLSPVWVRDTSSVAGPPANKAARPAFDNRGPKYQRQAE